MNTRSLAIQLKIALIIFICSVPQLGWTQIPSWSNVYETQPHNRINDITIGNDDLIYAGTGQGILLVSSDQGTTWNEVYRTFFAPILTVRSYGSMLYVGTNKGLYISSNQGVSWDSTLVGGIINDLIKLPDGRLLASDRKSIVQSLDGGLSWIVAFESEVNGSGWVFQLLSDGEILAGDIGGIEFCCGQLYLSSDNVQEWRLLEGWEPAWVSALAAPSMNTFIGGTEGGVRVSSDRGISWRGVNLAQQGMINSIVMDTTGNIWAGTNSGVISSKDDASSWQIAGLGNTNINTLVYTNAGFLVAGSDKGIYRARLHESTNLDNYIGLGYISAPYPNPTMNSVTIDIELAYPQYTSYTLYTTTGQLVHSTNYGFLSQGSHKIDITLSRC